MEYPKELEYFHNKHLNKTAIIIGGGPSLKHGQKYFDYAKNKYYFLGNNDSIFEKKLFKLDYFFISDSKNFERHGKENFIKKKVKKQKFFLNIKYIKNRLLTEDETKRAKGISIDMDSHVVFFNYKKYLNNPYRIDASSIFITFQVALLMGFKKIYLAGCDCGGPNYFIPKERPYYRLVKRWKYLKNFTEKYFPDVKIYVINPVNLKDIFPEDPDYFKS